MFMKKLNYVSPQTDVMEFRSEGVFCTSQFSTDYANNPNVYLGLGAEDDEFI